MKMKMKVEVEVEMEIICYEALSILVLPINDL